MPKTVTCLLRDNVPVWFLDDEIDFSGRESWRYLLALKSPQLFTFMDYWVTSPPKWPFWRSIEETKLDVNHHTFTFVNRPLIYASDTSESLRRDCSAYLKAALQVFAEDRDIESYIESCRSVADLFFEGSPHVTPHSIEYIQGRLRDFSLPPIKV